MAKRKKQEKGNLTRVTHAAEKAKLKLAGKPEKGKTVSNVQAIGTRKPLMDVTNIEELGPMPGKRTRKPTKKYGA
jgi:hypothetical protein